MKNGQTILAMTIAALCCCGTALAQQEKGDKEVGVGGQLFVTHTSSNFTGSATFQLSLGYYTSTRNYIGFEADPQLTFSHVANAGNDVSVGGFFGGNYRRLVGSPKGKVFPFIGGGGGGYLFPGGGNQATVYPEGGIKSYLSQKTSLEFSYKLLVFVNGKYNGFSDRSLSLATVSIRHIF